jgi:glycosyltransferase involved in cell wall biosynthesis
VHLRDVLRMNPLVSIIVPVQQVQPPVLYQSLESIISQTMQNYEVIICDDGSIEDISVIHNKYDKRFRILSLQRTDNPAIMRNAGIVSARGQFLAFLEVGDTWLPEKLEKQLLFLRQYPDMGLIGSNGYRVSADNEIPTMIYTEQETFHTHIFAHLLIRNLFVFSSVLVKSHLIKQTGMFCEDRAIFPVEDYDLWLRFAAIEECGYIAEPLVHCIAPSQHTFYQSLSAVQIMEAHLLMLERIEQFAKKYRLSIPKNILLESRGTYIREILRIMGFRSMFRSIHYCAHFIKNSIQQQFY